MGDIETAVKMLKVVSWEAIRKDRFSLTPAAVYDDMVRNTERILSCWSGDATRRQARLKCSVAEEEEDEEKEVCGEEEEDEKSPPPLRPKDKYDLDIDGEFRGNKCSGKFSGWGDVAQVAFEIHLDEMRTLLELRA